MFNLIYPHYLNKQLIRYSPELYKLSLCCKITDIAIDTVRLIYMPTSDNFYKLSLDSARFISGVYGNNILSSFASTLDVVNNIVEGQYRDAIAGAIISPYYLMGLKFAGNPPKLLSIYMMAMVGYSLYNMADDAIVLAHELGDPQVNERAQEVRSDFDHYLLESAHDIFCEKTGILCLVDNNEI